MVKKIAAPRKAAPKAPARKTAKAKSVTAPKTHKPKGSPKERLAYLNRGEMKALEARKGSPARRGPKGLPSFADDSASSKGVSRGDSYGTKGSGSTKTSTGSVSNTSTGSRGAGSNYGAGSGRPSSSTGGGNKGGYNSGVSGSRFGGASTQRPGMGGNAGQVQKGYAGPAGTIGTPRGYVNAERAAAVDKAMAPVAAVGQQLPYFTPGVGPIVGRVAGLAAKAVPAVMGAFNTARTGAQSAAEAAKIAEAYKAVEAYQAAKAAAGVKPMYTPAQTTTIFNRNNTLAQQRARAAAQPNVVERGVAKIDRGIDKVTKAMDLGTGDVARAKASAIIGGYGETARQSYDRFGNAIGGQRSDGRNQRADGKGDREGVAGGKTNKGGYSHGGPVKRTFKNK